MHKTSPLPLLLLLLFLSSPSLFGIVEVKGTMFISPLQQQISLALNNKDCDLFSQQFTSDAEFFGVVPGSPLPPAQGSDEIQQNCQKILGFGMVLSSPSRSLEYNTTKAAALSNYLFFSNSPVPTNLSKLVVGTATPDGLFQELMEFGSDEPPPSSFVYSIFTSFLGLGNNCTEFTEYMTHNVTLYETNYPAIEGKDKIYASCLLRKSDMGYSAIAQMYYNTAIPQAVAVEFADTASDAGYRRGAGLFWLNDDAMIYSATIFGGLGGSVE